MTYRFTSLRHSVEKLLEAEYFLAGVAFAEGLEFQFNLNAFLAACRSVSFVLQKSMSGVPGFDDWYAARRAEMKSDEAMGFFLELRNISQHEGPVSYVGGGRSDRQGWSWRFAGNRTKLPAALIGVDAAAACADHLAKIAKLLESFRSAYPWHSDICAALTPDGMAGLGFRLDDIGAVLGLPPGYLDVGESIPLEEKLRILRREFDPVETESVDRMAGGRFLDRDEAEMTFSRGTGTDLTDDIAMLIERGGEGTQRQMFLTALAQRINAIENRD